MYTFAIIILTALAISSQTILAPRVEIFAARPDWLLVLVIFMGLYAPPQRSIIASWFVGICADLTSIERLGLMSLSYGAVAMIVAAVRENVFRYSVVTQIALTFVLCVLVRTAWLVYARALYGSGGSAMAQATTQVVFVALYTALWAPLILGAMLGAARLLGVSRPRRVPLGVARLGYPDV